MKHRARLPFLVILLYTLKCQTPKTTAAVPTSEAGDPNVLSARAAVLRVGSSEEA